MASEIDKLVEKTKQDFESEIKQAKNSSDLEKLKIKYLGKKGPIQSLMQSLKDVSKEDRPVVGKTINILKQEIASILEHTLEEAILKEEEKSLSSEAIDISLPGRQQFTGRLHPITQMMDRICDILRGMGFSVQYGPDIDSDYYNFEALNFEADHPARDMQDTFYISSDMLLRTHTSNVQVRIMETHKPPIRVIAPGKVYRNENVSARSHVFFHQVEGFYIDTDVTFADLMGTMKEFFQKLFEKDLKFRFRASYFPFVEPGLEVDIECLLCEQKGCHICKGTGWLEVAGAGMIHPEVLKSGGIDPEVYSGYAWGMGVERMQMLYTSMTDIRHFTENDMRFLSQF